MNNDDEKKVVFKNKKIIIIFIIGLILITGIILLVRYLTDPVINFKKYLDEKDFIKIEKIYSELENDDDKNKIKEIFENKLKSIIEKYVKEELSYDDVMISLDEYSNVEKLYSYVKKAKNDVNEIKKSKENFLLGKNSENNDDAINTIMYYSEVIELDENNYRIAQEYINKNSESIKKSIFSEIDNLVSNNDYTLALEKLEEIGIILKDDSEIKNKIDEVNMGKQNYIKHYTENSNYKCFKDDTNKIRFYYDMTKLQYSNVANQKLELKENEISYFGYQTYTNSYDNIDENEFISQLIKNLR